MPRMRHPKLTGSEVDVPESAVPVHRISGWMTDDEWERAGFSEPEQESPPDSGEQKEAKQATPRPRARASSKESED